MVTSFGRVVREIVRLSEVVDLTPAHLRGTQIHEMLKDDLDYLMNSVLPKHWPILPGKTHGSQFERSFDVEANFEEV